MKRSLPSYRESRVGMYNTICAWLRGRYQQTLMKYLEILLPLFGGCVAGGIGFVWAALGMSATALGYLGVG